MGGGRLGAEGGVRNGAVRAERQSSDPVADTTRPFILQV